jgi:hypothetical protein
MSKTRTISRFALRIALVTQQRATKSLILHGSPCAVTAQFKTWILAKESGMKISLIIATQ